MVTFFVILHVIACIVLILMVLMQSGEAADLAGAFGGTGSKTAFGPRGATTFLSRLTTAMAIIFMITSLVLAILYTRSEKPILTEETVQEETVAPKKEGEKKEEEKAPSGEKAKETEKAEENNEQK
jgi:preprotein translocase subunit SecG